MAADPVCAGKHDSPVMPQVLVLGEGNTMGWVFVKVSAGVPEGSYPPPSEPAVIDQNGCVYHPHVLGMMAGQELKFLNSDGILHNVHGLPKENREFNLGMPATVTEQSVTLNRPEPLFTVKCDVHPWMNAYVAVMTHPFWAVTGENGAYAIGSLPAGTYTIEAWHERLGQQTSEVTVADGETATADFAFATPAGD
jgi:plastocyanin